jgi:PIN domain nuclease of toxin-antitoxin system
VGRVTEPATAPLAALNRTIGLRVADGTLTSIVRAAIEVSWTRDPFDRLIAAQAIVADVPLLTADRTILAHLPQATWG